MGSESSESSSFIYVTEITGGNPQSLESNKVLQSAEVIVVGARIAGSIASYHLARHGRKVLCLDEENIFVVGKISPVSKLVMITVFRE